MDTGRFGRLSDMFENLSNRGHLRDKGNEPYLATAVAAGQHSASSTTLFSGKSLLAIDQEQWHDDEILRDAKRLLRLALSPLLSRPLNSARILAESHSSILQKNITPLSSQVQQSKENTGTLKP